MSFDSFGKRRGFATKPQQAPSASPPPPPPPPPPPLPNSLRVAPNLLQIGNGEDDSAGAAARIMRFLLDTYHDEHGVNAETVLNAAGALAGFAAQEAIWEGFVRTGEIPLAQALARVETASGETYFFGDLLNTILTSTREGHLSVWGFVAGAAVSQGAQIVPPLAPMFEHCAATVGTPAFGVPILPGHLVLKELPREALRHWPQVKSILMSAGVQPLHWPLEIGVAAQKIIVLAKDALAADFGALVVMQAAIPMSKVDPRTVPGGTMVD